MQRCNSSEEEQQIYEIVCNNGPKVGIYKRFVEAFTAGTPFAHRQSLVSFRNPEPCKRLGLNDLHNRHKRLVTCGWCTTPYIIESDLENCCRLIYALDDNIRSCCR